MKGVRVVELDDHGFRNKTEVNATVVRELALPDGLAGELVEDFWRRYRHHSRPFVDASGTLRELRRRGLKTGVITNGRAATQNGTIDSIDIRGRQGRGGSGARRGQGFSSAKRI